MTVHLIGTIDVTDNWVKAACGVYEPPEMTGDTKAVDCRRCLCTRCFNLLISPDLKRNAIIDMMVAFRRPALTSAYREDET